MDKYGVDQKKPDSKQASQTPEACPDCGRKLIEHGQVLLCPKHGSKPLEK